MTKPVTLEDIKARQIKLSEMIARFEAQDKTECVIPETAIVLRAGERYAGIILDDVGNPYYHLILLPGEKEGIEWIESSYWAADQGGTLPTLREQSLLFTNLKDQFASTCYWSCERHKDFSGRAWYQRFDYGEQDTTDVHSKLHARVVRRVYIG